MVPPGHALRLLKALYSTRQAARCWRLHLQKVLANLGYMASLYDASLYVLNTPDAAGLIWVHVNDGIVMGSSPAVLHQLELDLGGCLEIKWDRDLTSVVGINLVQCQSGFALRQEKLTRTIASCFWDGVLTATHPLPSSFEAVADPAGNPDDSRAYLQIVMTLSYLAVGTRPDIAYAVNRLARYSSAPGVAHWKALRHLVNFVVLFQELRLNLFPRNAEEPLQCFVDSSWGGGAVRQVYVWNLCELLRLPGSLGEPAANDCGLLDLPGRVHGPQYCCPTIARDPTPSDGYVQERIHDFLEMRQPVGHSCRHQ